MDAHPQGTGVARGALGRGVLAIVLGGVVLGLAHNYLALAGRPPRGLTWIAEDRAEALPSLDALQGTGQAGDRAAAGSPGAAGAPFSTDMDDPMGIPAPPDSDGDLPLIPEMDRPIQIQLPAVKRFFDAGGALIVDAREVEEYAEGHLAGAINLPYDEVITDPARLEGLDADGRPIIVYCGGGTCELSINLGWGLVQAGHRKVLVFMGGYPEWEAAGYPVERGAPRVAEAS